MSVRLSEAALCPVAHMENPDDLLGFEDAEEDSVGRSPLSVKELSHLDIREPVIFRGQPTARGEIAQRLVSLKESRIPTPSGLG